MADPQFAPVIRPATDADGPALGAIIADVFADYENCPFVPDEFPELGAVASHFRGRNGQLWVAEIDGAIVGCLALVMTHDPGTAEIFKVYLARPSRGRGIAHRLLETGLAHARERGARAVTLWSDTRFLEGHRFYERHGFTRQPGIRALHDAGRSLEYNFRLEPIPPA